MKIFMSVIAILFASDCYAHHDYIKNIYIDKAKNAHIIYFDGKDKKITTKGRASNAILAPNRRTAAWLVLNSWIAEGDIEPGATQLAIYRNDKLRYIKCEPFIREYWFLAQGEQVAIDCGGRHFAGTQSLYNTASLVMIDSFFQADLPESKRPIWAK